ncbi:tripartite tricarboxylate transporter TctB family protein [Vibrio sp. Makdt]|uniref:tripartite tricarboxylate transporter TctB family protein n=1 Tax=Vibrio sp. Makdt TaxID=2998828 RepID=UPI0022CD20E6|nr:tripartite tricarboxylate transporter TctB family protein [Vibrio sp. Makdt]MDA0153217.1 tripartite tricarboxylate transporter TctB family protein [Vibrio sp. Makdt]
MSNSNLNRNIIFPSIMIVLSGIALALITQFDRPMYQDASVDAKFFPMMIVIAQIAICIVLIVQHKLKGATEKQEAMVTKMSIFGIGFLIGYALLINVAGYLYASLIAFIFYLVYFKVKKPIYYLIAVTFVIAVYYLFGEVFYIALPEASWS